MKHLRLLPMKSFYAKPVNVALSRADEYVIFKQYSNLHAHVVEGTQPSEQQRRACAAAGRGGGPGTAARASEPAVSSRSSLTPPQGSPARPGPAAHAPAGASPRCRRPLSRRGPQPPREGAGRPSPEARRKPGALLWGVPGAA